MTRTTSMLRSTLAFSIAVALAATSQAAIITSVSSSPTVGIAGMTTYSVTATAAAGEKIIGFDFVGGGGTYGVTGAMNQINPAGQATVFNDNNGFFGFVGADVSQDSQFKVTSTKGIPINPSESSTALKAAFNYNAASVVTDASNVWNFLQVATNAPADAIHLLGTLTVQNAQGENRLE